jgi:hypothetical protein
MELSQLASNPAGEDQIARARELCGHSSTLTAALDALLSTAPSRGQMLSFLEEARKANEQRNVEAELLRICQSFGIGEPSPQDKLLAMQIAMLREQNEMLQRIAVRVGSIAQQKPLTFTGALGAAILGNVLTG